MLAKPSVVLAQLGVTAFNHHVPAVLLSHRNRGSLCGRCLRLNNSSQRAFVSVADSAKRLRTLATGERRRRHDLLHDVQILTPLQPVVRSVCASDVAHGKLTLISTQMRALPGVRAKRLPLVIR